MPPRDAAPPRLHPLPPIASATEWIGGRFRTPFFVEEGGPYRPEAVIWLELPQGLIVGTTLLGPDPSSPSFARILLDTMHTPAVGPARRPERIRVADLALAAELRAALGKDVPVELGATPELDAVLQDMVTALARPDDSGTYLDGDRIPSEVVGALFAAAGFLWTIAPWKVLDDDAIIRVDAPALGVAGACLSVIGALGQNFGFLLFPSFAGYEAFLRAASAPRKGSRPPDLGTSYVALAFERGATLPAALRREVARERWPVTGPNAYPVLHHRDPDGLSRPLTTHDFELASACALALASLAGRHGGRLAQANFDPVSESSGDDDGIVVRLTVPYEAFDLFEPEPTPPAGAHDPHEPQPKRVGRNDPCPCGSGVKYKKCHLPLEEAAAVPDRAAVHTDDERLVFEMRAWAARWLGPTWNEANDAFVDPATTAALSLPWSVYHHEVDGRPVVAWFLEQRGRRLPDRQREWLAAQQEAWLSIWEVVDVTPGATLVLRDSLSGVERTVTEVSASRTLVHRDAILGRVVTYAGVSVLCGVHPRVLPPIEAAEPLRRARGRLRRKRALPPERLREFAVGRYLIEVWEDQVEDFDARLLIPPVLHNTDGDLFLVTRDHFDVVEGQEPQLEAALAALDGVQPPGPDDPDRCFEFTRPGNAMHRGWDSTAIGAAWVEPGSIRLETNSTARADALRSRIEASCAGMIRHRQREETDPSTLASRGPPIAESPVPSEALRLAVEFKRRHYADWPDSPLPALAGQTPRAAVRTAAGRQRVDLLLKDLENHESRLPREERFKVADLRATLGLAE